MLKTNKKSKQIWSLKIKDHLKNKHAMISTCFIFLLCCSFVYGVETYNVELTLAFTCFTSHKINKKKKDSKLINHWTIIKNECLYFNIVYPFGILNIK